MAESKRSETHLTGIVKSPKKSSLELFGVIAPFAIAFVSLATTIVLALMDSKGKASAVKTAQMDAVSKVLPFLSDTSERKNEMGLMTLKNFNQDSLLIQMMNSGMFSKATLEKVGIYVAINSTDSVTKKSVREYFQPRNIALKNALNELSKNAMSTDTNRTSEGPFVSKYNRLSGLDEGAAWAATFVSWCYNKDIRYFKPTGNINQLESEFSSRSVTFSLSDSLPAPGDLYFYTWKTQRAVGLVEYFSKKDSILHGIEGNSNENPQAHSYKVAKVFFTKKELQSERMRFARVENRQIN